MSQPQNAPLDYGRKDRWLTRKWVRRLIALAVVVSLGVIATLYGRPYYRRAYQQYWWDRCAEYAADPSDIIIERGKTLPEGSSGDDWFVLGEGDQKLRLRTPPGCWTRLANTELFMTAPQPGAVLFLHSMRSPSGTEMLVCVTRAANLPASVGALGLGETFILDPTAPTARRLTRPTLTLRNATDLLTDVTDASPLPVKIYAGRIDPLDPSRFTMQYSSGGETGTIEGRLKESRSQYRGKVLVYPEVALSVIDGPGAKRTRRKTGNSTPEPPDYSSVWRQRPPRP